jgi:hypothetical protein
VVGYFWDPLIVSDRRAERVDCDRDDDIDERSEEIDILDKG